MDKKIQLKIFLASPMDLENEREMFRNAVKSINETEAAKYNAEFSLICWEQNTRPGLSEDAQAVVNRQLRGNYDIFVCMFKERIGTPTKRAISGTVEEYERAKLKRVKTPELDIMAYFFECDNPRPEISDLKAKMGADGALFWDVRKEDDFERRVYNHLLETLSDYLKRIETKNKKAEIDAPQNASSVAFVYEDKVLMLQRAASSRFGPETWQLPGGKAEKGETPEQTAIREVMEETSFVIKNPEQLLKLTTICEKTGSHKTPLNMTLYIYKVKKKFKPKLNSESQSYEWVPLSMCDFGRKNLFMLNAKMLKVVWAEVYLNSTLRALHASLENSGGVQLPTALSGVSDTQLNTTYALLSLLGLTTYDRGIVLSSERFGKKILEELILLLADGESLFRDDKNALPRKNINISYEAIEQLKNIRSEAFCSNAALVSHLSCDTMLDNSTRRVCDTLILGEYGGKKYLLLRWDFYANKYQLIGKGLEKAIGTNEDDKIYAVMSKRLPSLTSYFDFVFITEYEAYHFSAGSVDNDPIWRKYLVDMAVLLPNNALDAPDIYRTINGINRETAAKIETSVKITPPQAKDMPLFVWCELSELIESPTSYRGHRVSGFGDLVGNLSEKCLQVVTESSLTSLKLPEEPKSDDLMEKLKKIFDNKYISD